MASFKSDRSFRKPYSRPSRAPEGRWLHDKASETNINASHISRLSAPFFTSGEPTGKLLVSNLHYEVTAKDLTTIFGQIGTLVREPLIRYDRSGRSSGQAIVSFETIAEAVRAKKQFNGILAKGQPMSVDFLAPRTPRVRSSSAPDASLANRIQKLPLSDRFSRDDLNAKPALLPLASIGPTRIRYNGPVGARSAVRGTKKGLKRPLTAEELDKELDAFMGDSNSTSVSIERGVATTETSAVTQDVEMA